MMPGLDTDEEEEDQTEILKKSKKFKVSSTFKYYAQILFDQLKTIHLWKDKI